MQETKTVSPFLTPDTVNYLQASRHMNPPPDSGSQKKDRDKKIQSAIQKGNYPLALTLLDQAIQDDPEVPELFYNFAVCCVRTQNYKKAVNILNDFLDKFPLFIEREQVYKMLIFSLIQIHENHKAIELIHERLKINPIDPVLLSMEAHIYEHQGDLDRAIEVHRSILRGFPDYKNSLNSLGYLILQKENPASQELTEAIKALKSVLKIDPNHPAYLDSFGVLLEKSGKHEEARRAFEKALALAPTNAILMDRLRHFDDQEKKEN